MAEQNCLIEKFSRYGPLNDEEREILSAFYTDEESFEPGEQLRRRGERAGSVLLVKQGWAYTSRELSDGSVQLIDVKLPGDMIGLRELSFMNAQTEAHALTDALVCRFDKKAVYQLFGRSQKLTTILFYLMTREQNYLVERLTEVGRRDAYAGLASFLLILRHRLEDVGFDTEGEFAFPLTQRHIADALGLTAVHVSRVVTRMREEGLAELGRGKARILDLPGLMEAADVSGDYFTGDRGWMAWS